MISSKINTVISTVWCWLRCNRSDDLTPTTLQHQRWGDGGVPPGGSVSHHRAVGQQAAVTALHLLLGQPDSLRPGLVVFTDPVGAGPGVGHFRAERLESF